MAARETEHPEDQSVTESDAVDGGHSNENAFAEWADDTSETTIQDEGCTSEETQPEEDFQGSSRIPDDQYDEELGAGQNVNNHLNLAQLMGCMIRILALQYRVLRIQRMLTILTSITTILTSIFEEHNLTTNKDERRYDMLKNKYESNKRKNTELDRQLQNAEDRRQSLERHGPQDGSVLLEINLKQHVNMESEIFYTRSPSHGHNGYRMKITVEEDWVDIASGTGRNLDVYFTLLEGEMDALLPWPFVPQISFIFIDNQGGCHVRRVMQAPNMRAFQRPEGNSVQNEQKHFCFNILFREVQHCMDEYDGGYILCLLVEVNNNYRSMAETLNP